MQGNPSVFLSDLNFHFLWLLDFSEGKSNYTNFLRVLLPVIGLFLNYLRFWVLFL
ncbi:hypothetical protein clem_14510 [Legionella clemsonensis]|uniref:Uncharacterized protein n=1 Tax=Legionella clemsonensis TaxID=1867846 RepID=A0A222P6F3_9GAMM|nr:hypothetical protein clem_14510 [Legionella clemsonensis]